jgi:hypothetical protein
MGRGGGGRTEEGEWPFGSAAAKLSKMAKEEKEEEKCQQWKEHRQRQQPIEKTCKRLWPNKY